MLDQELLSKNIISILELELLPLEKKMQIVEQTTELVQKRLMVALLKILNDDDKLTFLDLMNDPQKIEELNIFIGNKFPNLTEILGEQILLVKKELKAEADKAAA